MDANTEALTAKLKSLGKPLVLKEHIKKLEETELAKAKQLGLEAFKFDSNDAMLNVMGLAEYAKA
jgi:hypothetical protein